jgi:hypothetical protein
MVILDIKAIREIVGRNIIHEEINFREHPERMRLNTDF